MVTAVLVALSVGYLLGALPFGFLVARARGVNIFEVGSRNPGATNVRRVLGPGPGNLVFALDAGKGALATAWPLLLLGVAVAADGSGSLRLSSAWGEAGRLPWGIAGLVGALLGHSFSCFTGFRGGKGVATATGGVLVLMPLAALAAGAVWAATFYTSRYVSLASMLAAVALPVVAWLLGQPAALTGLSSVIALFVIIRHRTNVQRLLAGTESKFVKKPRNAPSS